METAAPNDANAAVDWLVWSTELSEGREEQLSKELQVRAPSCVSDSSLIWRSWQPDRCPQDARASVHRIVAPALRLGEGGERSFRNSGTLHREKMFLIRVLNHFLKTFEPNPTIWRRYLKLVIDRKGGDGELTEGEHASSRRSDSILEHLRNFRLQECGSGRAAV